MIFLWFFLLFFFQIESHAAEGYIGAHIDQNPEKVSEFIAHLPENDSILWQAWFFVQQGDFHQANALFYKLAEKNNPQGYRGLAESYLAGHGCVKDTDLALVLYEKAARLGLGPAQVNAAVLRADREDWKESKKWFDLALANSALLHMKDNVEALYHKRLDGRL